MVSVAHLMRPTSGHTQRVRASLGAEFHSRAHVLDESRGREVRARILLIDAVVRFQGER